MHVKSRSCGFTLVELIVTLAIVAIIATMAIPSFRNIIVSNSVTFDRDEFFTALNFARSEAIKNGRAVSICKSADAVNCDDSLSWAGGWLVFSDADRDGIKDAGDTALRAWDPLDGQVAVTHGGAKNRLTYESRGLLLRGDGTLTFSHPAGTRFDQKIDLSVTGRPTKG